MEVLLQIKNYVDGEISKIPGTDTSPFLKIDGSRAMTGNLDMGNHSIQKVGDPVNSDDVVTKNYVDAEIGYISTPFFEIRWYESNDWYFKYEYA